MAFDGLEAIYTLNDAQVLSGLDRVERAAMAHSGRMDRVFGQAQRSFERQIFGTGRLAAAVFSAVPAAFGLAAKALSDYEERWGSIGGGVRSFRDQWGLLWEDIGRDLSMTPADGGGLIGWLRDVREQVTLGAAEWAQFANAALGSWGFLIGGLPALLTRGGEGAGEIDAAAAKRERQAQEIMGRAVTRDILLQGDINQVSRIEMEAEKYRETAAAAVDRLVAERKISLETQTQLKHLINIQAESRRVAGMRRLEQEGERKANETAERLRRDDEAALRREQDAERARLRAFDALGIDVEQTRIQTMRERGLAREADLAAARLDIEKQALDIMENENLSLDERNTLIAAARAAGDDLIAAIAAGGGREERLSTRTLASGRASREVSRLVFGSEATTQATGRDTQLAETKKQTRLLEEIRDRVGPAVLGE